MSARPEAKMPRLRIEPLTPERWPDLEALFMAKGCSIPRGCWCMYYREGARVALPEGQTQPERRKQQMRALAAQQPPPGLLGYRGRTPVGWVAVAPRAQFGKLARSPVMKPVDDKPVWSVVCFVVPPEHRHQGVARALLRGAADWARAQGAELLEAYPIDKAERGDDSWIWHGAKSMFDSAGFTEVARRKPTRPVVRLALVPSAR
jgi:GNAT superfamily N-acetyltransferase